MEERQREKQRVSETAKSERMSDFASKQPMESVHQRLSRVRRSSVFSNPPATPVNAHAHAHAHARPTLYQTCQPAPQLTDATPGACTISQQLW
eukprot:COSAG01_NODE_14684_length_1422_cov_1.377173_1_plen_92_part_10